MIARAAYPFRLLLSVVAAAGLTGAIALSCGPLPEETPITAEAVADEPTPDEEAPAPMIVTIADRAPPEVDVDEPEPETNPDAECARDADCQDAMFCNGFEICGPAQRCVPGRPIECPSMLPYCDEDMDTCVCAPGSCPEGSMCDGFGCT